MHGHWRSVSQAKFPSGIPAYKQKRAQKNRGQVRGFFNCVNPENLLGTAFVFAGTGVNLDLVALRNKQGHRNQKARRNLGWF